MPENRQFWKLRKAVAKVAKEHGMKLSHRELHRVTNAYQDQMDVDNELSCAHDPKTYSDPTGEEAVRDWFQQWVTADIQAA